MRSWLTFSCVSLAAVLSGCGSNNYNLIGRARVEQLAPSPLFGADRDSSAWRFGSELGFASGPALAGTSEKTEIRGTEVRPEFPANLTIASQDISVGGYATHYNHDMAMNVSAELARIGGELYHRFEGSFWLLFPKGNACVMLGIGLSAEDSYAGYQEKHYQYDDGEYSAYYPGERAVAETQETVAPFAGISVGYLFPKIRIGASVSGYRFRDTHEIGAAHGEFPIGLSFYPRMGTPIAPVLRVGYSASTLGNGRGPVRIATGLEF